MPPPIQIGRIGQHLLPIWSVLMFTVTAPLRGLDLMVEYFEERSGWDARIPFLYKSVIVLVFLRAAHRSKDYCFLLLTVLATAAVHTVLAHVVLRRDKNLPSRKPHLRFRYLLLRSIDSCLICHEEAKNPVLLSCGHLYCANCIMTCIRQKRSKCSYCRRIPENADNLRLERVQTAQLALSIVLVFQLCIKHYIKDFDAASMDPCTLPHLSSVIHVVFVCFARWYWGLDWWKQVVTSFRDDRARDHRKAHQREDLQWAEELRKQLEVGLSWNLLIGHGMLGFGWLYGVDQWEERRPIEAERMEKSEGRGKEYLESVRINHDASSATGRNPEVTRDSLLSFTSVFEPEPHPGVVTRKDPMLRFGRPFTQATIGLTKEWRRTISSLTPQMSIQSFADFPPEVQHLATKLEDARSKNYQIPPLTTSIPDLDQDKAYRITAALRALRCERDDDEVVGRKIGFTNKSIWPEFNVDSSNWSYMYRSSVVDIDRQHEKNTKSYLCDLSALSNLELKIEPEIVLCLKAKPDAGMSDEQILECIEWIAHGFEIVASVYPGWKFTAADTTAAFALHGKLLLGRKCYLPMRSFTKTDLLKQLERFEIKLLCNGSVADEGVGRNVLGSPVQALRHLAELLEKDEINLPLQAGEMVTTGTLTRALGIKKGERWQTEIDGLDVSPLDVRFEMME